MVIYAYLYLPLPVVVFVIVFIILFLCCCYSYSRCRRYFFLIHHHNLLLHRQHSPRFPFDHINEQHRLCLWHCLVFLSFQRCDEHLKLRNSIFSGVLLRTLTLFTFAFFARCSPRAFSPFLVTVCGAVFSFTIRILKIVSHMRAIFSM